MTENKIDQRIFDSWALRRRSCQHPGGFEADRRELHRPPRSRAGTRVEGRKYDVLDDFAVSAISDAVGKSIPQQSESDDTDVSDAVIAALNDRIADLKEQNGRLAVELADLRASRDREIESLRMQLNDANHRAAELADRVATIAERQQAIAATPWWKRGRIAMKLLGPGSE